MSEYLKAVWPEFFGCVFEVWPARGARASLPKNGGPSPPTVGRALRGPRGRPDLTNEPKNQASFSGHSLIDFGTLKVNLEQKGTQKAKIKIGERPVLF